MQTTSIASAAPANSFLSLKASFKQIKKWLLPATFLLAFAFFAAPASAQVSINAEVSSNTFSNYTVSFAVFFTSAQTGLSASNFTVTGSVTGTSIIAVSGSGQTYVVLVGVPNNYQSSGTIILNMVNNTGVSPGVSGLPVASPSVTDVLYPLTGSMTLTSTNANPGYAKAGDIISLVVRSDHYSLNNISAVVDNQTFNGSAIGPSGGGYVVLGSGAPQGPLSYAWQFVTGFGTNGNGSGTSSIIFDSQAPTVGISAPSAAIVSGGGTKSVAYTVTYADANFGSSNLTTSGITLNTTGTATGTLGISGSGTTYAVTIYNISGNGTLGISVGAGYAVDLAGNTEANGAGPSSTVTVVPNVSPSISYASPQGYAVNTAIYPLTPSLTAGTEVFAGGGGRGVALDYNGNAYAINTAYNILMYPAGGGPPVTAYNATGVSTNVALAPISSTTSTLIFANDVNVLKSMDVVNGVVQAPVTIGPIFSGFSPVAATHPASGPDVIAVFIDNNSQIKFSARTSGVYSAPAPIVSAIAQPPIANVFAGGTALALNNYQGAVKMAFVGGDNNLYYSIYSGGTWSAVTPWVTPNISISSIGAFALDAQGNVWYSSGTSLYEITPGSTGGIAMATLPTVATGIAFDVSGNVYVNCGTEIEELQVPTNFLVTPALPAGLSINSTTGVISGTPTGLTAATNYMVTATAGAGNLTAPVNIQIITTPALSYGSAVNATPGMDITPITPTSTSIMAQKYNSTPTTFASVTAPTGVAVDAAGNVYVADNSNNIDKFAPGVAQPTSLGLGYSPLAIDGTGNFYFTNLTTSTLTGIYQFSVIPPGSTTVAYGSPATAPLSGNTCTGIAVDAAGNAYVSDNNANESVIEYTDGVLVNAQANPFAIGNGFSSASGVATDAAGNVYVSDAGAGTIDLIPASRAQWTTLATSLGAPANICIDGAGNLYYSDNNANTISELPAGSTTPVLIASGLGAIKALAIDGKGNLYAADYTNNVIDRFNPTGGYYINTVLPPGLSFNSSTGVISGTPTAPTTAGAAVNYTVTAYNTLGSASAVQNLAVIAAPPVVSYGGAQSFTIGKTVSPLIPVSTGVAAQGYNQVPGFMDFQFGAPYAVAVDTSLNVFVADPYNFGTMSVISFDDPAHKYLGNVIFEKGKGQWKQFIPEAYTYGFFCVATDSTGNIAITSGGIPPKEYTPFPASAVNHAYLDAPVIGISTDPQGNVYGTYSGNGTVLQLEPTGPTTIASGFIQPTGIAVDGLDNIFVGDRGNNTLYKIPAGGGTQIAVATGFNAPYQLAADGTGNIFIGDGGNGVVKELPAGGGPVITVIPNLKTPNGVAVDVKGALYVADAGFAQVRKYTPSGGYYISPSLPAGLSFNNSTGVISGTPTVITPVKDYKITAYNASGSTQTTLRFGVTPPSSKLASLTTSAGTLSPAFATGTTSYSVSVPFSSSQITVTPTSVDGGATVAVNGTTVSSGSPSGAIALSVGANTITIVVTASDHSSTKTYTVTVTRAAASNNALLANTGISYVMVGGNVEAVVTPTTADPNATVTVNGVTVAAGSASNPIPLGPGANTILITVTAQNGITKLTYKITVDGPLSGISTLSSLNISAGTLSTAFSASTTSYNDNVTGTVSSVTITPTTTDPNATVTVNGTAVTSGTGSGSIAVALGNTVIPTIVTAQDGVTTTTYTVTVIKAAAVNANLSAFKLSTGTLSPVFGAATTSYTASVANSINSITVTPTAADANATVKVNGTVVTSGTASGAISLNIGVNTITTIVTAQDRSTTKTYTVNVTRAASTDALLTSVKLTPVSTLTVVSGPSYVNYTTSVPNTTSSVTVTATEQDATATIKINGTTVASGAASAPVALVAGSNVINIVSTAQDGVTTKTYTITATRAPSAIATLSALTISSGTLMPAFATATTVYTATVPNATSSIMVTPTTTDPTATVTVNGATVTSGTASASIPLVAGANTITTLVTAQDGVTTKTYTTTVTRIASTDALLTSIKLIPASTLTVVTGPSYVNYTTTVANTSNSITVTATEQDPTATITVNGVAATSGTPSAPITLTVGTNVITIVSTAQDGKTTKTYTITATKPASSIATLSALKISSGTLAPVFAAATISYTASVTNATTSITVTPTTTDPTATVKVNGTAVTFGTASAAIPLTVGTNTITTIVTAQDGATTKTYTVTVTRAPSTDALLTSVKLTPASTLSVVTGPSYVNYTTSVPNTTASVTVTATEQDLTATIKVNGITTASGTASVPIALAVGSNTISIVSTAQDGVTAKTYTITATRAAAAGKNNLDEISVTKPAEQVTIENDGILVHHALSPNGDGINDYLTIDNITNYPDNSLMIVDRNGVMVYQTKGYDNSSKLFDGHSNLNGKMQLPGTYFYSLDYTVNGENKHTTGYIILKY